MRKIAATLMLGVLLCGLLSGCWSRRELNALAITVGIGIDKEGDNYLLSTQVVEPGEVASANGSSNRLPVTMFQQSGPSLHEALRKLTLSAPRRMYLSHLRMVVISEKAAEDGIGEILDFFLRHQEIRTDYFIVIARDNSAADVLQVLTPIENLPANALFTSLQTSEKFWAPTHGVHMDELANNILSEGTDPVITGIRIVGDKSARNEKFNVERVDSPAQFSYTGLGVFRGEHLIGWLDEDESKGFNYLKGNVSSTVGHSDCPGGGRVMAVTYKTRSEVTGKITNGRPAIGIRLFAEGNVSEVGCQLDLSDPESIAWLELQIAQSIEELIHTVVDKAQHVYGTDFVGFGAALRRAHPKVWKQYREDWEHAFVDLPVSVNVHYKIRRVGSITNLFNDKKE